MSPKTIAELKKFARFCLVGMTNTAVDFVVFALVNELLKLTAFSAWNVSGMDLALSIAQITAFVVATVNSFFLNKHFTFKNQKQNKQPFKFAVVSLFALTVSVVLINMFSNGLHLNEYLSKFLVFCFTFTINYTGNRFWVFRGNQETSDTIKI